MSGDERLSGEQLRDLASNGGGEWKNRAAKAATELLALRTRVAELEGDVRCSEAAGKDLDRRLTAMQQQRDALQASDKALRAAMVEIDMCAPPSGTEEPHQWLAVTCKQIARAALKKGATQ